MLLSPGSPLVLRGGLEISFLHYGDKRFSALLLEEEFSVRACRRRLRDKEAGEGSAGRLHRAPRRDTDAADSEEAGGRPSSCHFATSFASLSI